MKSGITALFFLLTSSLAVQAQMSLALKGGVGMTTMVGSKGDAPQEYDAKLGYHVGFALCSSRERWKRVGIESGLLVENKGSSIAHSETFEDEVYSVFSIRPSYPEGDIECNMLYLTVPTTVKLYLASFYINTGFYVSRVLAARTQLAEGELKEFYVEHDFATECPIGIGDDYENGDRLLPYDYGMIFGVGFTKGLVSIGLSCDYGLYDVCSSPDAVSSLTNRVVKLSLSYQL